MKENILIFDYNNLAKRCLYTPNVRISDTQFDHRMWRFMIWNSIFSSVVKLKATGVILAGDKHSWRKIIYPAYKLDRKLRAKKNSLLGIRDINWEEFFIEMDSFGKILSENLPFIYITEKSCEADDIIAIICKINKDKNYTIVSVDCDYRQLTYEENIRQWDPLKKTYLDKLDNLEYWVNFNSLRGQAKDNIYNVFTPENYPIEEIMMNDEYKNTRKPVLSEKNVEKILMDIGLEKWLTDVGPEEAKKKNQLLAKKVSNKPIIYLEEDVQSRFNKNKKLIDFREIPETLKKRVSEKFTSLHIIKSDDFYPFFKEMGWNDVLDNYSFVETKLYEMF